MLIHKEFFLRYLDMSKNDINLNEFIDYQNIHNAKLNQNYNNGSFICC